MTDKQEPWEWEVYQPHERVAVIGCGPAGLLAAWAAVRAGFKVEIFTNRKTPSDQSGAQYIHMAVPGIISEQEGQPIFYSHIGTSRGYATKIYGAAFNPRDTSWDKFKPGLHTAWSMQTVYRRLWSYFEDGIIEANIDQGRLDRIARHYHTVFSSMPLNRLVDVGVEHFRTETVYTFPLMMTSGYGVRADRPNVIVYNGAEQFQWYRQSRIFGQEWTEWPGAVGENGVQHEVEMYGHQWVPGLLRQVQKPVACTLPLHLMLPPNVRLIGRYGKWAKGTLAHDSYLDAMNHLESATSSATTTPPPTSESTVTS